MTEPVLDHVVVNVRTDMDAAAGAFEGAGFTLTPRGFHSLGSVNHLMVFGHDYLELLGVPPERPDARPEISAAPRGLNGLVFKTDDVERTFEHLRAIGFDGDPPRAFSRPVTVDGAEHEARFRTVTVRPDVFPFGRVYFCEHGTPELVWHAAWQTHANGATGIDEMVVVADAPGDVAERFSGLLGQPVEATAAEAAVRFDGGRLTATDASAFAARFGHAAVPAGAWGAVFGAVVVRVDSLAAFDAASDPGEAFESLPAGDGRRVFRSAAFDTIIEFRAAP